MKLQPSLRTKPKAASTVEVSPAPKQQPVVNTVQAAPSAGGCERFRPLIARYNWDTRVMLAIMKAESNCDPNVTGDKSLAFQSNGRTYGYSVSLLQVHILPGREHCDSHDPATNIACAYQIWKNQSYGAWSVYRNGKYAKFL